jgi:nucleotide-binding universal stress UspA family protein
MEPIPSSVIVGVTGSHENTDALQYAIAEARQSNRGITLVHAVTPVLPPPPMGVLITDDAWLELGEGIVARARDEMEQLGDLPSVATVVREGHPAVVFCELSKGAAKVVLQHQDLSRLHRIVTGSTVASVAAHAHCPVVSVPAGFSTRTPTGTIAVGVRGDGGPRQVLEAAFAEAAARGSSLRVAHGWKVPAAYDDLRAQWSAEDDAHITSAMTDLRERHPDVDVRVDVHNEWPPEVLADVANSSDLLVVGRHSGMSMLPPRLGSLARAAVAHATCPVMIVPL